MANINPTSVENALSAGCRMNVRLGRKPDELTANALVGGSGLLYCASTATLTTQDTCLGNAWLNY